MTAVTEDRAADPVAEAAPGRAVKAADSRLLRAAQQGLVKAGNSSVRAAWRFGQALDALSDRYTQAQLARETGLSTGTVYKYRRFYGLYQRPEMAVAASETLETFDIGILIALFGQTSPAGHGRPLAGRHFRYACRHCGSFEVGRDEIDEDGNLVEPEAATGD